MKLDIDWLYYLATNIIGMSEEEFLKSTPKKIFALADIHLSINSPAEKEKEVEEKYIDDFIF